MQNTLPHLFYFHQVARTGSFTEAANLLNISQSSVSYQIKNLEEKLGSQLIHRQRRQKIVLTPAGDKLAHHCVGLYRDLGSLLDTLSSQEPMGLLRVTAPVTFGSKILSGMLASFRRQCPQVEVVLKPGDTTLDLFREDIDLAIRSGEGNEKGLQYRLVARERRQLVAAPSYQKPLPTTIEELVQHHHILRNAINIDWAWCDDFSYTEATKIESTYGMLEATLAGMGLCLLPTYLIAEYLENGQLVAVDLSGIEAEKNVMYACYAQTAYEDPKVEAFIKVLKEHLVNSYAGCFDF